MTTASHIPRRSPKGYATIAIDLRNAGEETARFTDLTTIARLITLLENLAPGASVFFDFGVISITNVDLAAIAQRLQEAPE